MEFTNIQVSKAFFATADDAQLSDFIARNELDGVLTFNRNSVWCKGAEHGREWGFTRCETINTKKNTRRGNWYIHRI